MTPVEIQRHLVAFNVLHGGLGDYGIRADGKRDDDGAMGPRTANALVAAARLYGIDGEHWKAQTADLLKDWLAAKESQAVSLGLRALRVALQEWCAGVCEVPPGSNSGPRIREYLAGCVRRRTGEALELTASEWCAAAASWCVERAKRGDETAPHGWRAAGAEIETELKERGAWMAVEHVRTGLYRLRPGDLVILTRGTASWQRHVCRLVAHKGDRIWTIGGNENNRWRLTPRRLSDADMLGFGAYPESWTDEDERRVAELCPGTAAKMVSEPICT